MRKDGTPTTKCLNPTHNSYQIQQRNDSSHRRRRSSFSSSSTQHPSSASPPKQRRLMFTSFVNRFHHKSITRKQSKNMKKEKRSLHCLPTELAIKIIMFLDYYSILHLGQTCKQFYQFCYRDHHLLWQFLFHQDYTTIVNKSFVSSIFLKELSYFQLYKNHHQLSLRWRHGQVHTRYLIGHEDSVYCLVWLDSNRIISGSRDRSIKVWDLSIQERPREMKNKKGGGEEKSCLVLTKTEHEGSVLCLRVSSDMTFMVSGSSDATCLIWSLPNFEPQTRLEGHLGGVLDIAIIKDKYIVSSSRDATIRIWDKEQQGIELRRLTGHAGPVNALGSHEGFVVSASGDTTLKLWDVETGACLRTFVGHTRGLACVKFDGQFIYSGGQDNKLKIWDVRSGQCVSTLEGHSDLIRTIDSFEVNKMVYSIYLNRWTFNAGQDKRIMVLDFGYDLITID
ncbi:WD40-repeat-containing domain protein [Cokeromyces recurvatus]|uniref:WD40-repeat-containing domain protein n=1 Tax=Cokeromyces recurvatus TaxID=90255 RepID=UPI002220DE96|nr:WD40-repeat-containing domain protein [Cokeromyces recurvatus]KAI7907528.1 WD40-repeat-containing domain protein [Cokeromyces recurvatus]